MSKLRAYLIVLAMICIIGVFAWVFVTQSPRDEDADQLSSEQIVATPPSPQVQLYLANSKGFQYLVSLTERGFEPTTLTVQKGDTVRFTNNSAGELWISATGELGALYPGTGKECGQSTFDSCKILKHGEFWEFSFASAGTWSYQNNRNPKMKGVVRVQ